MSVKKRANPEASGDSTFKLHTSVMECCDGHGLTTAKYVVPVDLTKAIGNLVIKVNGVNTSINLALPANSTPKTVRLAIAKALKDNGFDPYYTSDNLIGIAVADGEVCVIGEAVLVSLSNTTATNFDVRSEQARIVVSRFIIANDNLDSTLTFKGVDDDLVGSGDLKADIETSLGVLGVSFTKVVTNLVGTDYTVDIHSTAECEDLQYDDVEATCVKVYPDFI